MTLPGSVTTVLNTALLSACALMVIGIHVANAESRLLPPPMMVETFNAPVETMAELPTVEYISNEEMERIYLNARRSFDQTPARTRPEATGSTQGTTFVAEDGTQIQTTQKRSPSNISTVNAVSAASGVPLGEVSIRIAYENMTIEDIMNQVAGKVAEQSGAWNVQWRLKEENRGIIDRRVNMNAESSFDEFLSHLTGKINNLTGVRLFVKVFEASRVIIISDSF